MIIMVGLSVVATVAVVKLSDKSQEPIPAWIEIVVLKFLSRIVCLHKMAEQIQHPSKKALSQEDKGDVARKDYTENGIASKRFHESMLISLSNISNVRRTRDHRKTTNCTVSLAEKWTVIAVVVSRCFALLFTVIVVTCTVTILIYIKVMSEIDFANALGENRDRWLSETVF